tara:strand:+ start:191 stop:850 length:660 start_codon:yes stop_codon:yes gene_type:complete
MAYIGNSPANVGNYQLVDNIAGSFDGSETSFALASGGITITPAKSAQLLVGVNGVMQQPDDTGTNGFKVSGSNIVFSSEPESGDTFWAVYQGQNVDIGIPSNGAVSEAQMNISNSPTNGYFLSAQSGDTGGLTWAEVDALPSQSGNAGKFLTTNASTASWAALAGATGGGTDEVFYENDQTITTNYELTANKNAMSAGPLTINSSIEVTVPSGATWIIV